MGAIIAGMADTVGPPPGAPPIINLPPEPLAIAAAGALGGDGKGYVLVTFTTEHGPHSVRLAADRAEGLAEAIKTCVTQARTGLTIVKAPGNGHGLLKG